MTENNFGVLYNSREMALFLQKVVQEQSALLATTKERRSRLQRNAEEATKDIEEGAASREEPTNIEENDTFELIPASRTS